MCTLVALHKCHPEVPLAIAANRDEWLDRETGDFRFWEIGERRVLAPEDLQAGGTWLGVNDLGVFAAITNRPGMRDDRRRSRGLLVLDVLANTSAAEAGAQLAELPEAAYNGFNLFVADGREAVVAVYDERVSVKFCEAGAQVVGNADPNDRSHPKVRRILERAEVIAQGAPHSWLDDLAELCRGHEGEPPYGATCVHAGEYGTKSSTLLRFSIRGPELLHHGWGAPCKTDYSDLGIQLTDLRAGSTDTGGVNGDGSEHNLRTARA